MNEALREQVLSKPFTDTAKLASGTSDTPARDGDFSATAGVSSLQVFDGEDLMEGDRRLMQAAQVCVNELLSLGYHAPHAPLCPSHPTLAAAVPPPTYPLPPMSIVDACLVPCATTGKGGAVGRGEAGRQGVRSLPGVSWQDAR